MQYEQIFDFTIKVKEYENFQSVSIYREKETFDADFANALLKVHGIKSASNTGMILNDNPNQKDHWLVVIANTGALVLELIVEAIDNEIAKRAKESITEFLNQKPSPTHIAIHPMEDGRYIEVHARITKQKEEYEFWGKPIVEMYQDIEFHHASTTEGVLVPEIGEEILNEDLEFLAA